jgi:Ni/Co efflux regulator RcnB
MKKSIILITGIMAMAGTQAALASNDSHNMNGDMHSAMHGDQHKEAMKEHKHGNMGQMKGMKDHKQMKQDDTGQMKGMFLVKKEIDGFTVSFHAMKAKEGMQHGGTHNLMVKVEKNGNALVDLAVNSKVTHPNSKSESKMLMKMGDWYMAGYDLGHEGQHQLMVLFKTADGSKHFGGVYYPASE